MNQRGGEWYESESFWTETYPFIFPEARFIAAAENVPKITSLTGVSSGSVLDLACGPGRYAIPLALAGYAVTGVDRTRYLLNKAQELAAVAGADVEWVEQDMRSFLRPATFDLAINIFTSFGYFDDEAENRRVLENVFASLKPGGVFVFDHLGKETLAAKFQPTISESLPDGKVLVQRASVIDGWSRTDTQWILIDGPRATSYRIRHWLYSGREIRDLLNSVGFEDVNLYGTLVGAPYDPQAQRLIAVARKPMS